MPTVSEQNPKKTAEAAGWTRSAILGGIFVILGILKAAYNPYPVGEFGQDGGYYYQMARHVVQGEGLLTSVSNYHQGIKKLPYPTAGYPFWPLVLGGAGAVLGLEKAATMLPELLYFASLYLLYQLTNRMLASWGEPASVRLGSMRILDPGHLMVLVLGLNPVYFKFTSLPFTEALAFTLLFGTLLALGRAAEGRPVFWASVAGGLAALSYLTRYQFLGLVILVPAVLLLAGVRYRGAALVSAIVILAPLAAWFGYVSARYGGFKIGMLVDFAGARQTPELETFQFLVRDSSFTNMLSDRIWGAVSVAFNPMSPFSYVRSFGPAAYLVPAALIYLLVRPAVLLSAIRRMRQPRYMLTVATIGAALFCLAQVHAMHANRFGGWFFQFRQGLPLVLALVPCTAFLSTRPERTVRAGAVFAIVSSLVVLTLGLKREFDRLPEYGPPTTAQMELGRWIDRQPIPPVFVTTRPYVLAGITRGLFHGVSCEESRKQMMTYFEVVGVTHLITLGSEQNCAFFSSVHDLLEPVETFGMGKEGIALWRPVALHRTPVRVY